MKRYKPITIYKTQVSYPEKSKNPEKAPATPKPTGLNFWLALVALFLFSMILRQALKNNPVKSFLWTLAGFLSIYLLLYLGVNDL